MHFPTHTQFIQAGFMAAIFGPLAALVMYLNWKREKAERGERRGFEVETKRDDEVG